LSSSGQKDSRRPSAETVAFADVWPIVGIDSNGNELVVNDADDLWIGIAGTIHFQAGRAPCCRGREQHRFLFAAGALEARAAPWLPHHAVGKHPEERHTDRLIIMRGCSR